jgi:hypothetical protein
MISCSMRLERDLLELVGSYSEVVVGDHCSCSEVAVGEYCSCSEVVVGDRRPCLEGVEEELLEG